MSVTSPLGLPISRIDGLLKVTGQAKYAADFNVADLTHGVVLSSSIAKGRIKRIDANAALAVEGVLQVLTHENRPKLARSASRYQDEVGADGTPFRPLYDDRVHYSGQPVALVIAEELEIAQFAASLVRIEYEAEAHVTDLRRQCEHAVELPRPVKPRGDAETAFRNADARFEGEYRSPIEHHNPMETHAATVAWKGDGSITVYDKTQGVKNSQRYIANVFYLAEDDVRVLSPYVGGAFGSGLRPQYHLALAVMAAHALRRSVRVALTRQQMFTHCYRPQTFQRIALGANADGTLASIMHDAVAGTSQYEDYHDNVVTWSGLLYSCPNTKFTHRLAKLDLSTPGDMRAPGGATGLYGLECAMDELAERLKLEPLELRLRTYSDRDQNEDKPYSSKELRACYRQGAEAFGWAKRNPEPRSMRNGNDLIGWGMATGTWEAMQQETSAKAVLTADGRLEVKCAITDIGTGTYTILAQIAADMLGLPIENVTVKLGDSTLPEAPVEGGSWTAASAGSAVHDACLAVRKELLVLARRISASPFADLSLDDVTFSDGKILNRRMPPQAVSIVDVMHQSKVNQIEKEATAEPKGDDSYSRYAHSAVFAEVKIDEQLGVIRVTRVVDAVAAGRILNPKTARSQILGGVVWGIGMALHEETLLDHNLGRIANHNLGEYHVPVNADIHDIEVIFVDERDAIINPLGVKGIGEIGIVGTAAAIANAVYHATGRRVRDLPITLDKVLDSSASRYSVFK